MYITNDLIYSISNEKYGELSLVSATINLKRNKKIKVSGIYRCYHYNLPNYLRDLHLFLDESTNIKNHLIVGDMNIDLLTFDKATEDYW